jgi:hypothetical protein
MKPKTSKPQISMAVRHCGVVVLGVLTSGFGGGKIVGANFLTGHGVPVKPFLGLGLVIGQSCPLRLD